MVSKHKKAVLKRYPDAFCKMSQLSGMFFVYSPKQLLAWQPSPALAWKTAHLAPKV